jgi:GT2 family glycosyltransferase/2-polyprenyl-3-methyl-5-hydroxy-6-metoxy-1,4-benzoquinol methylase
MPNYDFALDMKTDNSNSLILRNIKPNSVVLEMGPAHGRMTKYLKEQLNCEVYIVEKDEEAGKVAAQYATDAIIGEEQGDLEKPWWSANLIDQKFDYIIFADVLEHLHDPKTVLENAKFLLKDTGSVLISIPNIAHNAVLIDLLQNKFEYREIGILDKTHLKFFTHNSLKTFVASAGFTVVQECNAINIVSNTEFENSYMQLPTHIGEYLMARPYGEVYQFVWELKRSDIQLTIVTPVFNKWNFTKSYLNDLLKLDQSKTEIIIVNNASTDETAANLTEYVSRSHNIKVINNETNLGFGKACNIGYQAAQGKYVMFLNNDIRVKDKMDSWTDIIIKQCDDNNLVSPTGGKVDPSNDFQFLYETNDPTKEINYLSGWCIAAQKNVWDKLIASGEGGPFSEQYFCYFEDTHLSFLANKLNINFKLVDIPVVHFGKVSSKQLNTFSLYKESRTIFSKNWK